MLAASYMYSQKCYQKFKFVSSKTVNKIEVTFLKSKKILIIDFDLSKQK